MAGPTSTWQGGRLEITARRSGLRTAVTLLRDGTPVGAASGLGRVRLPLPAGEEPGPTVLVLAPVPGVVARAVLLVPRPTPEAGGDDVPAGVTTALELATAERHPFDPAPGTLAARLRALEDRHPRLWASRHVVLAVGRVLGALLGLAVLLQALVRPLLQWLAGLVPSVDLPAIPWPDVDLPSIPWPDVDWPDLPDVSLPGWLLAVLATAEYWGPVLVAVVLAVREVRRKRRGPAAREGREAPVGEDGVDAHR
ncbi:hypothetical protein GCU56_15345 [Geodermatophilus sabuli]|uniref:Uncharacterized protein n=1 Tax=Geodermatophilus sabuli TaxID=1564158 RepID=A0A7K3W3I4_9ACTN|nr:hypothetical protein [Geodermatophilus sabuli]NEK59240.1 hypothetical protein [Geodermatophilus sabuli]